MLIKNGYVIDPASGLSGVTDVLIVDGKITVGANLTANGEVYDASGCYIFPGLIDMHCHLRDPGLTYKEDIASGTKAAAKGGFTSICCMANTNPVNDNAVVTTYIAKTAAEAGAVRVYPIGAITKGLKGEELAEMGEMQAAGIVAVSDDGKPVMNAQMMRLAMQYAAAFNLPVISHCEDINLVAGGVMNEGVTSTVIGLKGSPRAAEEVQIAREIALSESLNLHIHIAHVSTRGGAELIRSAKARGALVTAETAPHYLTLDDTACMGYDGNTKVNPPLRTQDDIAALKTALADGTIDAIATDHAPHHSDEKRVEFALAASGFSGFETALPLCIEALSGIMPLLGIIERMSVAPARIVGIPGGNLAGSADVIVYDPHAEWTVRSADFLSKGKNTPYEGRTLKGRVILTLVGGKVAWQA